VSEAKIPGAGADAGALAMFAAELRAWRKRLGWTQVELGSKINYSGSFVSDIERGWRTPSLDFAERCDAETGAPGTFVRMYGMIKGESFLGWFSMFLHFEGKARKIHEWDMRCLPGLLQTEDYARALFRASRPHDSADKIDHDVAARTSRQEIFNRDDPPFAWFILDETVLRRIFGNRKIMHDQMAKVLEMAGRPNVVIQVVPSTVPNCPGVAGPMTLFDIPESPSVGYTEGYETGRAIEAPDEVAKLITVFDLLRAVALPPEESISLITRIRSEYGE
jgi:transcriptional regulator with XRE-family HTH domain